MYVAVFYGSAVLSGHELSPQVTALSGTGFSREGAGGSAINFCNPDPHLLSVFLAIFRALPAWAEQDEHKRCSNGVAI